MRNDTVKPDESRSESENLLVAAIYIAAISPLWLMSFIYPVFQVFLPEGNIVLTPALRITATILIGIIDYGLAYIPLYFSSRRKKVWFNIVFFSLTMLWCIFGGVFWYIVTFW